MTSITAPTDARLAALHDWLATTLRTRDYTLAPASASASFRRYFRVTLATPAAIAGDARTLVAMDAPPPQENCAPFVHVAALLAAAGIHAPTVHAQDLDRGFLLLTDLGTTTYLQALDEDNANALFADAMDTLVRWQSATREGMLPPYDATLLRRELMLFPEWYLARHRGVTLTDKEQASLLTVFERIIATNLAQPAVFVHRDFMPRNLMVSTPNPGVLDFQDAGRPHHLRRRFAVQGFVPELARGARPRLTIRYWERARRAKLRCRPTSPVLADVEWMGLPRHLKCSASSRRIFHRDGKPAYVEDTPRFLAYVRPVAGRYDELKPLLRLLDRIEQRATTTGYTFNGATTVIGAMILAAGRGERMRPLSDVTPKPLLCAGGKPLIVWQIEAFVRAGLTDIVINASHRADDLAAALGDGRSSAHASRGRARPSRWKWRAASRPRCRCCPPAR